MNISMTFSDEHGRAHYTLEADPARLQGLRNAFGAVLMVSTLTPYQQPTNDAPLIFLGSLAWANETDGLAIPPQSIRGGHSSLAVPITDAQMAVIEKVRNGGEPRFSLRLRVIAQGADGKIGQYGSHGMESYPYSVPLEIWHKAMDGCGFGRIRIFELPPTPEAANAEWRAAADALADAANRLRRGDNPGAVTSSRVALKRIISAIEQPLGITKPKSRWGERVDAVSAALIARHKSNGVDAYNLSAELVKTLFGFQSGAAHRLYATPENAEYALMLATSLYSYLARVPIPEALDTIDSPEA